MRNSKKALSFVLVLTIIVSMFSAAFVVTVNAEETIELFLQNTLGWNTVKAVAEQGNANAELVTGTTNIYKVTVPDDIGSVKFTNNAGNEETKYIDDPQDGQLYMPDKTDKTVADGVTVYNGKVEYYKVRNVIFMIGDGMGEEQIKTGDIYLGEQMAMKNMPYHSMVTTSSLSSGPTDSAAAATAMSTGFKTTNNAIGQLSDGTYVETLNEFAYQRGMMNGVIVTQKVQHATPAGFTAHVPTRYSYNEIAAQQIKNGLFDIILGGGGEHFVGLDDSIAANNYEKINEVAEINNVPPDKNVLGIFADNYISADDTVKLKDLTTEGLKRLTNDNGFFVMIEGSDIDSKAHSNEMYNMCKELEVFNDAIEVAQDYVEEHPDTLLLVTADHETGDLHLPENTTRQDLMSTAANGYFKSTNHTGVKVPLYAMGARAWELCENKIIDNTDTSKYIRKFLNETYGEKEPYDANDHTNDKIFFEKPESWENAYVHIKGDINKDAFPGVKMAKVESEDNIYELNLYDYEKSGEVNAENVNLNSSASSGKVQAPKGNSIILRGDADSDGSVTIADVTKIQKSLAAMESLSDNQKLAADVNSEGGVEIGDATEIQKFLAKMGNRYKIEEQISQDTTTAPIVTTTSPIITTTAPIITTTAPIVTTTAPIVTTTTPIITTTVPIITTTAPIITTTKPVITTTAPIITTTEPIITTVPPQPSTITLYFTDALHWGAAYAYCWTANDEHPLGSFPGTAMTFVEKNPFGENVYSVQVPSDIAGIIFSGGTGKPQTVNITDGLFNNAGFYAIDETDPSDTNKHKFGTYTMAEPEPDKELVLVFSDGTDAQKTIEIKFEGYKKLYRIESGENTASAEGSWIKYVPNAGVFYFQKPDSWNEAYVFLFAGVYGIMDFPGNKMEHVEGNIYQYMLSEDNIPNGIPAFSMVFSSGDGLYKTVDVKFEGYNKIYYILIDTTTEKAYGNWSNYGDDNPPVYPDDKTIYLDTNNLSAWARQGVTSGLFVWNRTGSTWIEPTYIENSNPPIYSYEVPGEYVGQGGLFARINPELSLSDFTYANWTKKYVYNQTIDTLIPTDDDVSTFSFTSITDGETWPDRLEGHWREYREPKEPNPTAPPADTSITVYFENKYNWAPAAIYYWYGNTTGSIEMAATGKNGSNGAIWSAVIPSELLENIEGILFRNNYDQSKWGDYFQSENIPVADLYDKIAFYFDNETLQSLNSYKHP
ncbi:MAG: alkaline phosphatase [Oscillospiraceae bacterium]|jgi:alkaline phosphatase|nr:alkaline phosphatase [Oscillospiraceae bacterium]